MEYQIPLVPYEPSLGPGFADLVSSVLAELGFVVDPVLEGDLGAPAEHYDAIWLAVDAGQVVGSVAMRKARGDAGGGETGPGAAELKRMYLRPEYRGCGLGRRLLGVALVWARAQGYASVRLDTGSSMVAAQRFYEAAGFTRAGARTEVGGADRRCEVLYEMAL